jgi:CubicO group peptidase (beta-lactamase class C family)
VDDKRIFWEEEFGFVDGNGSRPIDVNTMFSIQSMTKSFTALAVLMAVQDGMVSLDTPIKAYLPEFTVNSIFDENPEEKITLRHLLTHRAGFTHEAPFGSNYDDRNDFQRHIESISSTWLRYPVGYRLSYSNLGFAVAGYLLQQRSGRPFPQYVKETIFDPLRMRSSSLDMTVIEETENRAVGHSPHQSRVPLRIPMIPSGGIYTTIGDMAKYLQFHINKGVVNGQRILRADLIEEMHRIQFANARQRSGYCLGLIREPVSHTYNLYHSGAGYGFSSDMIMYPELELGVVLLCNSSNNEFSSWRLRNVIDKCIVDRYGATPVDEPGTERMKKLDNGDPRIQLIVGHYGGEHGKSIEYDGENIGIRYPSGEFYELEFYDDAGELVGMFGIYSEVRFLPSYHDRRAPLVIRNRRVGNGATFNIEDFNDAPNDPRGLNKPSWRDYVGEYEMLRYGKPDDTFTVAIRNGYLYINDRQCTEYVQGMFFTYDGEVLDFRSDQPMYANRPLRRKKGSSTP